MKEPKEIVPPCLNPSADRFAFGANWARFLTKLTPDRIKRAESALRELLSLSEFTNLSFLDIGSGSGLSSLAARNLGAQVYSFDFDPLSVACTRELKQRFHPQDDGWNIAEGSALNEDFLRSLGNFDIVYSWGVLHHTGAMWQALELATLPVKPGGLLCVAIYNDQGAFSKIWWYIKRLYNRSNQLLRFLIVITIATFFEVLQAVYRLATLRNPLPFKRWRELQQQRGMSIWHDWVDWVGGFPFEVASPEQIFKFFYQRGFTLVNLRTKSGGWGCCEYLFSKNNN